MLPQPTGISRGFGRATQNYAKFVRLHDLRHTAATLALKWGIHPKKVQEMLDHSSIRTTLDLYSHVLPVMREETAQRMDGLFQFPSVHLPERSLSILLSNCPGRQFGVVNQ